MPDLLIRDLSPEIMARLKSQAAAHGCSMQSEAKAIIEQGVQLSMEEWAAMVRRSSGQLAARRGRLAGSSAELIREGHAERDAAIERAVQDASDGGEDE